MTRRRNKKGTRRVSRPAESGDQLVDIRNVPSTSTAPTSGNTKTKRENGRRRARNAEKQKDEEEVTVLANMVSNTIFTSFEKYQEVLGKSESEKTDPQTTPRAKGFKPRLECEKPSADAKFARILATQIDKKLGCCIQP
ncbi:hypothetical protein L5515_016981 [Caenorhabditis briggsae]|uniref:Uncharacterized protein n=1 Tax=Caenorhabditis briggsae TaxID=6238 RepID=A0AAE9JPG4_CAEBR|nr:hypothetical protein L5515_016981 [Caenorhabditis briggsae]